MSAGEYWATAFRLICRNVLFMAPLAVAAVTLSAAAGLSFEVPEMAAVVIGAAASNLTRRPAREALYRRVARRPRMTPADYASLREMEAELGFEPTEPPASVLPAPVRPARWQPPRPPARDKYLYGSVWSTSGSGARSGARCLQCDEGMERHKSPAARKPTIAEMKRGQARYTVPWAMRVDLGGGLWLNPAVPVWDRPGGTAQMRVELGEDGYHVWPSAASAPSPGGGAGVGYLPVAVLEGTR